MVLMNVWASGCGPLAESPALDRFEEKNRDRIVVLRIDTKDLSEDAMNFIRSSTSSTRSFVTPAATHTDQS